jgi:hypothetical protein
MSYGTVSVGTQHATEAGKPINLLTTSELGADINAVCETGGTAYA